MPNATPAARELDVWLGQRGVGQDHGAQGWAEAGYGGGAMDGNNGAAGGGASGLAWVVSGHDNPLIVAGGGGGGGHESLTNAHDGGAGGAGGNPPQDGLRGTSGGEWGPGGKGGGNSHWGGEPGEGADNDYTTGGGGGGGAGYPHGGGGGQAGEIGFGSYTLASGGGGGGGQSFAADTVTVLDNGVAPFGDGRLMIFAGDPQRLDCADTHNARRLSVPRDVTAYGFVAVGGAGTRGHSDAPQGTGALASGMLDVDGVDTLDYWVGCNGYTHDGAGYGTRGGGGSAGAGGNNGGDGGGSTMIAIGSPFTPLVAAGGGGGSGGDINNCNGYPGEKCGGQGGSGGGVDGTRYYYNGQQGGGNGGDGGKANSHTSNGRPSPNGGSGTDSPTLSGGGGGGGAGYPSGGGGGHHATLSPGGGGGAGGSYLSDQRVSGGMISAGGSLNNGYILLLPVKRLTTDLTVTKKVTGAAANPYGFGPFWIQVSCTLNNRSTLESTITPHSGQSMRFAGIARGSTCTITETDAAGASTPAQPQTVVMGAEPAAVTLVNNFAATSFDVTVHSAIRAEGGGANPGVAMTLGELGVQLSCTFNGKAITLPAPVADGALTFTGQKTWDDAGQTFTVAGLPVGATCTATQSAGSGASSIDYAVDGAAQTGPSARFTLGADPTAVTVNDGYQLAPMAVTKHADGNSSAPPDAVYPVALSCTFQGNGVSLLAASAVFDVVVGGTHTVHNLPIGAECTVTETDTGSAVAVSYLPSRTVPITADPVPDVTVTNTFHSGALLVSVGTSGAASSWSNVGFTVSVTCTIGGIEVLNEDFGPTHASGGSRTFNPGGGSDCVATETGTGGASNQRYSSSADGAPSPTPVSVAVAPDGTAALTIDNVFPAAPLVVTTKTSGAGAIYATSPTTVTIGDCTFNGIPIDVIRGHGGYPPPEKTVSAKMPAQGDSWIISELPTGAECIVTETDAGGATTSSFSATNGDPASMVAGNAIQLTIRQPDAENSATTATIDNVFDLAALDVSVHLDGAAAWAANAPYQVAVQCTFLGTPIPRLGPNGTAMLQFNPSGALVPNQGSEALKTLPVGALCDAVETDAGGATTVGYDPVGVITVPGGGAAIAVTNTFTATTLTTNKVLAGNAAAAHAADVFQFDSGCRFNGKLVPPAPVSVDPNGSPVFTLIGGGSHTAIGLPVGAACSITEFDAQHATQVTPDRTQAVTLTTDAAALTFANAFDVTSLTVSEVLTGDGVATYGLGQTFTAQVECVWPADQSAPDRPGDRVDLPNNGVVTLSAANNFASTFQAPVGITCRVGQGMQMATKQSLPDPVTLIAGTQHALPITSDYRLGSITVTKSAQGTFSPTRHFGFLATCVWPDGPGAPVALPLNADASGTFSLTSGGAHTVAVLLGATCSVAETDSGGAIRVAVDAHGLNASVTGQAASLTVAPNTVNTAAFTNFMPGSLPLTGSEISWARGALALLLLLGGFGLLLVLRRRRA